MPNRAGAGSCALGGGSKAAVSGENDANARAERCFGESAAGQAPPAPVHRGVAGNAKTPEQPDQSVGEIAVKQPHPAGR